MVVVPAACSPPPPPAPLSVVDVSAAGQHHTCAIISDGSVKCWGANDWGQLEERDNIGFEFASLGDRHHFAGTRAITAGAIFTCASLGDGTVRCWGNGTHGQLGNGTNISSSAMPVAVNGLTGVTEVSAGDFHVCAVLADGSGQCWGKNSYGGLGDGSTNDSNVPVGLMSGLAGAISVSASVGNTSCALLADGSLRCWGFNGQGQLGAESTSINSTVPLTVLNITRCDRSRSWAETTRAQSWPITPFGAGVAMVPGQLGNGSVTYGEITPQVVSGLSDAVEVDGGSHFSCAVTIDGSRSAARAMIPDGWAMAPLSTQPYPSPWLESRKGLPFSFHRAHSFLISNGLSVRCWGRNDSGQLGDQTTNDSSVPVEVSGLP